MNGLQIIEHKSSRVLTTAQIAEGYGTDAARISENFTRNRGRYEEGKHFYFLEGEALRQFKEAYPQIAENLKFAPILYLWTEKGALLHAKSLNTDQAWAVYEELLETYFGAKVKRLPNTYIEALEELVASEKEKLFLQAQNSELHAQNAIMAPKAEYFDDLIDRTILTNFRETAKELNLPPRWFTQELLRLKYLFRDAKGQLLPYEQKNKGLFEVKESLNNRTGWAGLQTLVTPKGRETFRRLFADDRRKA